LRARKHRSNQRFSCLALTPEETRARNAPGTSFEPYPIPTLVPPKTVLEAFGRLRYRTYPNRQRAHIAIKDALNNEVKIAFGQGNLRWKPGHMRSAYGAICCQLL
jgi:hypothetical protein